MFRVLLSSASMVILVGCCWMVQSVEIAGVGDDDDLMIVMLIVDVFFVVLIDFYGEDEEERKSKQDTASK